jgi:hypothetical protein
MRWVNRAAVVAALLCAGCGNYSTEDLEFLAALPERESLRADVPAGAAGTASGALTAGAAACGIGPAEVWLQSKPASDSWNAGVDFVVGLVDAVRRHSPTSRSEDGNAREWGPFDDDRHPGHETRVLMQRERPPELAGAPRYGYAFQSRPKGTAAWTTLIAGVFEGPSAARGKGWVVLDFEAFWTAGVNGTDTPHGQMRIGYDRTSEPAVILLSLTQGGFGMEQQFEYFYRGWEDRSGAFAYRFRQNGDVLTVETSYDPLGAGRDQVSFVAASGATGGFQQCWDAAACLVYVNDPANFTKVSTSCAMPPCPPTGDAAACATVPASPF